MEGMISQKNVVEELVRRLKNYPSDLVTPIIDHLYPQLRLADLDHLALHRNSLKNREFGKKTPKI